MQKSMLMFTYTAWLLCLKHGLVSKPFIHLTWLCWGSSMQVLFEAQGRGGKNKSVEMEDIKFHQCVRLARFENDRTISFIPPDGAFDLMCAPSSPCPALLCC